MSTTNTQQEFEEGRVTLQQYWENNLKEVKSQQEQLMQHKTELESIDNLLQDLPTQLKHKIMVLLKPLFISRFP